MDSPRYDVVTRLLADRQPACGATTVVAIDGPSGAGKTSLADGLAAVTGAQVLHLDHLYPGWNGLAATPPVVAGILESVAVGDIGRAHRWSWVRDRPGPLLHVPPTPLLIVDGVGSGAAVVRPFLSLLVWVEAPVDVRRRRALARDGGAYEPFWDTWASQEARHFAADPTRVHADLVVTTS